MHRTAAPNRWVYRATAPPRTCRISCYEILHTDRQRETVPLTDIHFPTLISELHTVTRLYELCLLGIAEKVFPYISRGFNATQQWDNLCYLTIEVNEDPKNYLFLDLTPERFPALESLRLREIYLENPRLHKLKKLQLVCTPRELGRVNPKTGADFMEMLQRSPLRTLQLDHYLQQAPPGAFISDPPFMSDPPFNKLELQCIEVLWVETGDFHRARYFFHQVAYIRASASVTIALRRGQTCGLLLWRQPKPEDPEQHPFWMQFSKVSLRIPPQYGTLTLPVSSLAGPGCLTYEVLADNVSKRSPHCLRLTSEDIKAVYPSSSPSLKQVEVIADWGDPTTVDVIWPFLEKTASLEQLIICNIAWRHDALPLAEKLTPPLERNDPSKLLLPSLQCIRIENVRLDDRNGRELRDKILEYATWRAEQGHSLQAVSVGPINRAREYEDVYRNPA